MKKRDFVSLAAVAALLGSVVWADDDALKGGAEEVPAIPVPEVDELEESIKQLDEEFDKEQAEGKVEKKSINRRVEVRTGDGNNSITVRSFGKIIHVGPDGKVEIKEFDTDSDDPSINRLQLNLRRFLEGKRHKDADGEDAGEDAAEEGEEVEVEESGLDRLLNPRARGGLLDFDNLPGNIGALLEGFGGAGGAAGEIRIQGADGVEHHIELGQPLDVDGLRKQIQEAFENSGIDIQADVAGELNKAMSRLRENSSIARQRIRQRLDDRARDRSQDQLEKITDKLDQILQRIEKLETEVDGLKNRTEI